MHSPRQLSLLELSRLVITSSTTLKGSSMVRLPCNAEEKIPTLARYICKAQMRFVQCVYYNDLSLVTLA